MNATISFSPRLGTRLSKARRWLPGTRQIRDWPRATAGHNHRTAGQEVDVAGELARLMGDNHPIAVGRIEDVDLSGFDDEQIDVGLTGAKDRFAIRVVVGRRQRFENASSAVVSWGNAASSLEGHCSTSMRFRPRDVHREVYALAACQGTRSTVEACRLRQRRERPVRESSPQSACSSAGFAAGDLLNLGARVQRSRDARVDTRSSRARPAVSRGATRHFLGRHNRRPTWSPGRLCHAPKSLPTNPIDEFTRSLGGVRVRLGWVENSRPPIAQTQTGLRRIGRNCLSPTPATFPASPAARSRWVIAVDVAGNRLRAADSADPERPVAAPGGLINRNRQPVGTSTRVSSRPIASSRSFPASTKKSAALKSVNADRPSATPRPTRRANVSRSTSSSASRAQRRGDGHSQLRAGPQALMRRNRRPQFHARRERGDIARVHRCRYIAMNLSGTTPTRATRRRSGRRTGPSSAASCRALQVAADLIQSASRTRARRGLAASDRGGSGSCPDAASTKPGESIMTPMPP